MGCQACLAQPDNPRYSTFRHVTIQATHKEWCENVSRQLIITVIQYTHSQTTLSATSHQANNYVEESNKHQQQVKRKTHWQNPAPQLPQV